MWTVTNEATGEVTSVEMMGAHAHLRNRGGNRAQR